MARLGIELLSVFGMPPTEHVKLAADLGCGHISMALTQLPFNPHGYAPWSLRDDASLRREMKAAMHFFRSGGNASDLTALDPQLIGYVQLCDVPLQPIEQDYMKEAMFGRMAPGTGELPLAQFVRALPRDVPIGLEVPMLVMAEAGVTPYDRLRPAVVTTRALLRSAEL